MCNGWNHSNGCDCGFGPPYDRGVPDYFDRHVGSDGGRDLSASGPRCAKLNSIVSDPRLTTQLASTFLWQSYVGRTTGRGIGKARRIKEVRKAPTVYIVRHGVGFPRHDLLILDPQIPPDTVEQGQVEISLAELRAGWRNFSADYKITNASIPRWLRGLDLTDIPEIASEAMIAQKHYFIAMHPPRIVWTSTAVQSAAAVASPALGVSGKAQGKDICTAGVISIDSKGRKGVTTALHALTKHSGTIFVRGAPGNIRTTDTITDSCFIEVDHSQLPPSGACHGPLSGVTPARGEEVWFDGATSGRISTHVDGWTPELPWFIPNVQSRIITPAVTDGGDSGAALMSQAGQVVGFAYYRTGFNAKSPHSAWIWAESVFLALDLQ